MDSRNPPSQADDRNVQAGITQPAIDHVRVRHFVSREEVGEEAGWREVGVAPLLSGCIK